MDIIEHIFNDKHKILKAYNNLAWNKKLIINIPELKILFSRFDKDVNHFRRYQKNTFSKTLNDLNIKKYNMIYYDYVGFF